MKIKSHLFLTCILFITFIANAYSSGWQWASRFGFDGPNPSQWAEEFWETEGLAIACDKAGNTYITGIFLGSSSWDSQTFASSLIAPPWQFSGSHALNAFVAKYNNAGKMQWCRKISSDVTVAGRGITLDEEENIYICGTFIGTAVFPDILGKIELKQANQSDISRSFVAKYNNNGAILWARKIEDPQAADGDSNGSNTARGIAADKEGNTYITGNFSGKVAFENIVLGTNAANSEDVEIFLAKYDVNGNAVWAKQAGSPNSTSPSNSFESGRGVAVNSQTGHVFITGVFTQEDADFSGITLSCDTAYAQMFVACYDASSGAIQWANQADAISNGDPILPGAEGNAIAVDDNDNCYIAGSLDGIQAFGSTTINSGNFNEPTGDAFVAKCDQSGQFIWAKQEGGKSTLQYGTGIAVDNAGVYVVGGYTESMKFSDGDSTNISHGFDNVFVLRYDQDGKIMFKKRVYTEGENDGITAYGIATSNNYLMQSFRIVGSHNGSPEGSKVYFEDVFNTGIINLPFETYTYGPDDLRLGGFVAKYVTDLLPEKRK